MPPWQATNPAYPLGQVVFATPTTRVPALDQLEAIGFVLRRDATIDRLGINVLGAAGAGGVARLMLYESHAVNRGPGALVAAATEINTTVGGFRTGAFGPIAFLAGVQYWVVSWFGVAAPGGAGVTALPLSSIAVSPLGYFESSLSSAFGVLTGALAYGAAPDPFPQAGLSATSSAAVAVFARFSA